MAEFNFIFTYKDHENLINFLLRNGAEIIPNILYPSPNYILIKEAHNLQKLDEELKLISSNIISWSEYKKYPFIFRELEKQFEDGIKKVFYINHRNGGPYIDYNYYGQRKKENESILLLLPSSVHYYPKYWINELRSEFQVSAELKNRFKFIVNYIQSTSTKFSLKNKKRNYWVGKNAFELLSSGTAKVNIELDMTPLKESHRIKF
jgi:hypothetical protein